METLKPGMVIYARTGRRFVVTSVNEMREPTVQALDDPSDRRYLLPWPLCYAIGWRLELGRALEDDDAEPKAG